VTVQYNQSLHNTPGPDMGEEESTFSVKKDLSAADKVNIAMVMRWYLYFMHILRNNIHIYTQDSVQNHIYSPCRLSIELIDKTVCKNTDFY